MAKIAEILEAEKKRGTPDQDRVIYLWSDGSFYHAYNFSAWLCVRYIHEFKATRRVFKNSSKMEIVLIGFPKTSLEKFSPMDAKCEPFGEKNMILTLPPSMVRPAEGSTLEQEYKNWKTTIPITESKESQAASSGGDSANAPLSKKIASSAPMSMTGIMKQILEFPVESRSPIECMVFLSDIKGRLSSIL